MWNIIRPAVVSFASLTFITGVIYPAVVTGIAKVAFPSQADGSVIERDGKPIGSSLIAQPFRDAKYFWPRPSAAGANGYDAASGSGSNLAPSNPTLADAVATRVATLRGTGGSQLYVPVDLVTASGSGLDPDISLAAAEFQIARVARARNLPEARVRELVQAHTLLPAMDIFGDLRLNVLELNLELDRPSHPTTHAFDDHRGPFGYRAQGFIPDPK